MSLESTELPSKKENNYNSKLMIPKSWFPPVLKTLILFSEMPKLTILPPKWLNKKLKISKKMNKLLNKPPNKKLLKKKLTLKLMT